MKLGACLFSKVRFTTDLDGNTEICFRVEPAGRYGARRLAKRIAGSTDRLFTLSVSEGAGERTPRQNAFMWAVCADLAARSGGAEEPEDIYSHMLERYGVRDTLFVPEEALPRLKGVFRDVRTIGKSVVDGEEMAAVLCTYGSSGYDAGQMSRLLEGLLNEAAEAADEGGRDEDLIEN